MIFATLRQFNDLCYLPAGTHGFRFKGVNRVQKREMESQLHLPGTVKNRLLQSGLCGISNNGKTCRIVDGKICHNLAIESHFGLFQTVD